MPRNGGGGSWLGSPPLLPKPSMAVSLVSPGGNTPSSGGAYYVPAWRFVSYRQQNGGGAPTSASPPPSVLSSGAQPPTFPVTSSRLPNHLPRDPRLWSREDVHKFLLWCQDEFDLPPVDTDQFQMNGKALCLLMKSDFTERAQRSGDILYNVVHLFALQATVTEESQRQRYDQHLRMCTYSGGGLLPSDAASAPSNWATAAWPFISSDYHNVGHVIHNQSFGGLPPTSNSGTVDSTVTLSPAPSTDSQSGGSPGRDHGMEDAADERGSRRSRHPSDSAGSECGSSPPSTPLSLTTKPKASSIGDSFSCPEPPTPTLAANVEQPVTNGRLLWDFLHQLLNDPAQRYVRCITWKEQEKGVFKISDPHGLAQLWGMQKNHLNMNFDKMSRALRYYYRVNILKKVQGERHCYQFLRQPLELKACKQRALLGKYCVKPATPSERKSPPVTVKCEGENA